MRFPIGARTSGTSRSRIRRSRCTMIALPAGVWLGAAEPFQLTLGQEQAEEYGVPRYEVTTEDGYSERGCIGISTIPRRRTSLPHQYPSEQYDWYMICFEPQEMSGGEDSPELDEYFYAGRLSRRYLSPRTPKCRHISGIWRVCRGWKTDRKFRSSRLPTARTPIPCSPPHRRHKIIWKIFLHRYQKCGTMVAADALVPCKPAIGFEILWKSDEFRKILQDCVPS